MDDARFSNHHHRIQNVQHVYSTWKLRKEKYFNRKRVTLYVSDFFKEDSS